MTFTQDLKPQSIKAALADTRQRAVLLEEFDALKHNNTWVLAHKEVASKIVGNNWVFKVKYNPDGSISKYNARFVAMDFR